MTEDGGWMAEKRRISNIHRKVSCGEQGILNDEVRRADDRISELADWRLEI